MKKFLASFMMFTSLSLVLMFPAFAEHTASHTTGTVNANGTPGTINRMTTDGTYNGVPYNGYYGPRTGTYGAYGVDGTNGTYDSTRMNYRPYNATRPAVRALGTTTRRTFGWGWLGLLGLFGLVGMRSRARDEVK